MLLVCRPQYDLATRYSRKFCDSAISRLSDKFDFQEVSSRASFDEQVKSSSTRCFIFYGHGTDEALWGANLPVVDTGNLANCRTVYTHACSSSKRLGAQAVKNDKVEVYWGYTDRIGLFNDRLFEDLANVGLLRLFEGATFAEAEAAFREMSDALFLDDKVKFIYKAQILRNEKRLQLHGDTERTLVRSESS